MAGVDATGVGGIGASCRHAGVAGVIGAWKAPGSGDWPLYDARASLERPSHDLESDSWAGVRCASTEKPPHDQECDSLAGACCRSLTFCAL